MLEGEAWRVCSPLRRQISEPIGEIRRLRRRARARTRPLRHCDGGCRVSALARASARPHRVRVPSRRRRHALATGHAPGHAARRALTPSPRRPARAGCVAQCLCP